MSSPYVVPTRRSLDTIALLQQRGVRMTVLTNSLAATDEPLVHSAYRRYREEMLRQGVELYELAPLRLPLALGGGVQGEALGRLHAKTVVIDREIFYIGSFNFDHRSATHNTELGLIVFSPQLAEQAAGLAGCGQARGGLSLAAGSGWAQHRVARHRCRWQRYSHGRTGGRLVATFAAGDGRPVRA